MPRKDDSHQGLWFCFTRGNKQTVLLNAVESEDADQAVQLLKGNICFSKEEVDTALISACDLGLKFLVQELVCRGADVQFKDESGNTPLLTSAKEGFVEIVRFLLKKKADVNASNSAGDTALILSMKQAGSLEMVRVLLDQEEIDIYHQNLKGYTALMRAVEVMDVDVIKILMDRYKKEEVGWNASGQVCRNSEGMTADKIADECGLGTIYNILKTYTRRRVSLLEIATDGHDTRSFEILLDCHFVEKPDVRGTLMEMLKSANVKEAKSLIENEILIIKMLLKCRLDVDTNWHGGIYSLYVAVCLGDYRLVALLCRYLDQGQKLNSPFVLQALKVAAKAGRCDLINLLLKYKPDIINTANYHSSPLDCALRCGQPKSAKLLVKRGAKMDIEIALHSAVRRQLPKYLSFVFKHNKKEVIEHVLKCGHLNRIFLSAAEVGNLKVIKRLLAAGANINQADIYGKTPLAVAKNRDVARLLISKGANVNPLHPDGDTDLIKTLNSSESEESKLEIVKVLLENGASVNDRGCRGKTPLMIAASRTKSVTILQTLLDYGADINDHDYAGNTALMEAVCNDQPLVVLFLLKFHKEKNRCLNVQNYSGKTALMYAAMYNNMQVLQQLIDFGADVNITDVNGITSLMSAAVKNEFSVLEALITAGSDVNCQTNSGYSALMVASTNCRIDAIKILLNSGAEVNAVSKINSTQTALSLISDMSDQMETCISCIRVLLRKGASSSYINPGFFYRMIQDCEVSLILELIRCGLGPTDVKSENVVQYSVDNKNIPMISPLCMALLVGNISLARSFVGNVFLTKSDITSLTGNQILRRVLKRRRNQDCMNFLDVWCSQPFSLYQLTFLTVLSAVGVSPGREDRVNMLALPLIIKDKLLFASFCFYL